MKVSTKLASGILGGVNTGGHMGDDVQCLLGNDFELVDRCRIRKYFTQLWYGQHPMHIEGNSRTIYSVGAMMRKTP